MKKNLIICLLALTATTSLPAQTITPEVEKRAEELLQQMTLKEKLDYIGGYNAFYIRAIPRLGIPEIRMADGPQGVRNNTQSTMYSCGIAAASTWDRQLVHKMGEGLGKDARARGVHILLGPGVNIYRSPLCGRNFEYFGEDPYLSGETAVQYIKGVQSQGVMATIKHFAGNNQEWNRHHVSSDIDERTLQEIYLTSFRKAVKEANVAAVMNSYNLLNSVHATENPHLNIEILRNQWGFRGILMSDWNSVYSAVGAANGGLDLEMPSGLFMNNENLSKAIETGIVTEETIDLKVRHILQNLIAYGFFDRPQLDKSLPEHNPFCDSVALQLAREAVVLLKNEGDILPLKKGNIVVMGPSADTIFTGGGSGFVHPFSTVSVLDGMLNMGRKYKITPIVPNVRFDLDGLGMMTGSTPGMKAEYFTNKNLKGTPALVRTETSVNHNWGSKSPAQGIPQDGFSVRWSGSLKAPANKTLRLTVSGDDGYRLSVNGKELLADWTNHSPTSREAYLEMKAGQTYDFVVEYYDNANDALIRFGAEEVNLQQNDAQIAAADAVVLCLGFNSTTEHEGADRTFTLPKGQDSLINAVAARNPNVILVVNSGGGFDMSQWQDKVKAILMAWYPGQQGGQAIAEILTGQISPSGKLPISIEKRLEDNPTFNSYYDNLMRNKKRNSPHLRVCYDEGIFMGYRGYDRTGVEPLYPFGYGLSYSSFEYSNLKIEREGAKAIISFDVRNTGKYDAAEVAQVYVSDINASVPRPLKELKGYDKVFLKKGETKRVSVELNEDAFSYFDMDANEFTVEPGDFEILVGASSKDIRLKGTIDYR